MTEKTKFKQTVSEHFDKQAKQSIHQDALLELGSSSNDRFLQSPYIFVEEYISKNYSKKILDYCCGTGLYSIFPAKQGSNVFGLDISKDSIDLAKLRAKAHDVESFCQFEVGDAENIPFQDNFFNLVLSYGSLSYLDMKKAFKEINRVLCYGGTLIVVDSLGHNPFFNLNRKKNIMNYAPAYYKKLKTLKIKELTRASDDYFTLEEVKYFDLMTVLGSFIARYFQINLNPAIFLKIDSFLSKIPFLNKCCFKAVFILKKK